MVYPTNCSQFSIASTSTVIPKEEEAKVNAVKKVLIPIDFSDYSAKACELGINYAHAVGAEVMIMHAYFSPYFPSAIPMGDTLAYQVNEEESVQHIFLALTSRSHHDQCRMILLAISDDLLFRQAFT